ncbi:MAG: hypothetical protein WC917_00635 [Bacilli bacterium]|jgi:hypothetical protein
MLWTVAITIFLQVVVCIVFFRIIKTDLKYIKRIDFLIQKYKKEIDFLKLHERGK